MVVSSLAASPSPPGRSIGVNWPGGEGLAARLGCLLFEAREGPGTSSHVSDVKGRKTRRKRGCTWVSEQQEERRYQVTYHTYQASGGRVSCVILTEH